MTTLQELFDRDDVVQLVDAELRKLMDEQPEFVYRDDSASSGPCHYDKGPGGNPDKCCGCIFGQAFQRLGVPRDQLDGMGIRKFLYGTKSLKWMETTIARFPNAPQYWRQIQSGQDHGRRWGDLKYLLPEVSA